MKIACYETDVTEAQRELIEPMLPASKKLGRKRTSLRKILNALLYIAKAGCQWRLLPVDFPPWQTVYAVFRNWIAEGVWEQADARLRAKAGKLGPHQSILLPVPGRLAVVEDLRQRLPMHPRFPQHLPPANPFHQHTASQLAPVFHIGIHLSLCPMVPPFSSASSHT